MRTTVDWLRRLAAISEAPTTQLTPFRISVPGFVPLALTDWIIHAKPIIPGSGQREGSSPVTRSVLFLPDTPGQTQTLHERHRLGSDLAALATLASGRRVEVTHEVVLRVPQLGRTMTLPFAQVIDQALLGPLPEDFAARLQSLLSLALGLNDKDLSVLSAASSLHHSAALLFDRDARAAYTLIIAGIEVLSREYGSPPTQWSQWDQSRSWDEFMVRHEVSPVISTAIRDKLMADRQLRLKATFTHYASTQLSDSFFDEPLESWTYGVDANNDTWLPPTPGPCQRVRDVITPDRGQLRTALGKSYDLRSALVHQGDWLELMSTSMRAQTPVDCSAPLPFMVLRLMLAALIRAEMLRRSQPLSLPNVTVGERGDAT